MYHTYNGQGRQALTKTASHKIRIIDVYFIKVERHSFLLSTKARQLWMGDRVLGGLRKNILVSLPKKKI